MSKNYRRKKTVNEIALVASGYTYVCLECNGENYTGPAPDEVECNECGAKFSVSRLRHKCANIGTQKQNDTPMNEGQLTFDVFGASILRPPSNQSGILLHDQSQSIDLEFRGTQPPTFKDLKSWGNDLTGYLTE